MTDKRRQEFEAAVRATYQESLFPSFARNGLGVYLNLDLQGLWAGYQLARQSTDEQDEAWIAEKQVYGTEVYEESGHDSFISVDDVREYLRGRKA